MQKNISSPEQSFEKIIFKVQSQLSPTNRLFSLFFYNNIISTLFDILDFILNPIVVIFSVLFTIATELLFFISSYTSSFKLSGSEIIATLAVGYIIASLVRIFIFIAKGKSI